ncbi:HAD-IB family phosphatase [Megalodesulfovibrio paquesii]
MTHAVLVTDFDGTMTVNDFYKLVAARLLPPDALTPWEDYRAGHITHFTALQRIFARLDATDAQLEEIVRLMEPVQGLADAVGRLRTAGWEVIVASAGCDWYIRRILTALGLEMEVHANPGTHEGPVGPLRMEAPDKSPFFCLETGVDKAAIVRFHLERGATVAFAGDGFADLPAALATPAARRFARADLATALAERGEPYRPFETWPQVADALLAEGGRP